jgi:tripartite-type tricarboxylate transporter receptor subunit TctC
MPDAVHAGLAAWAARSHSWSGLALGWIHKPVSLLSVLPYVQAGRMKLIATMGDNRVAGHDFPTVAETVPGFNVGALLGFVAPAGTPKPIIQKIQADTARALAQPDVQKRAQEFGMQIVASSPEQFDAFIASEMKRWGRIVTEAKIEQE